MVPAAFDARLDDVCAEFVAAMVELAHLLGGRNATSLSRQPRAEHVGHQLEVGFFADRTTHRGLRADVAGGANQFGMRIAHLVERNPTLLHLGDEHAARQPVVDQTTRTIGPAECADGERHGLGHYRLELAVRGVIPVMLGHVGHTGCVVANINFGPGAPDDDELRLCGDVSDGRRAVELGISPWFNSIGFARAGAKAIAVDTDAARIAETRKRASAAEVPVQCLETDLADLGDIASTSCEVVLAAHTIGDVDDLGRLLRQVHRILKPSMPFVLSMPHPFASVASGRPYGADERTIGSWFTALNRSNFRVDQVIELGASPTQPSPITLVLRSRKEGS